MATAKPFEHAGCCAYLDGQPDAAAQTTDLRAYPGMPAD